MQKILYSFLLVLFFSCNTNIKDSTRNTDDEVFVKDSIVEIDTISLLKNTINNKQYTYFEHYKGDFNGDSLEDMVVVFEYECKNFDKEDDSYINEIPKCRILFLLKNKGGTEYEKILQDSTVIDCSVCGGAGVGDPFSDMVISKDTIEVVALYGASTKTEYKEVYVFSKSNKKWQKMLSIAAAYNSTPLSNVDGVEIDTLTVKDFGEVFLGENMN